MSDDDLPETVGELADDLDRFIEEKRNQQPDPRRPGEQASEVEALRHADRAKRQIREYTQRVKQEFIDAYRSDLFELADALEEEGHDTDRLRRHVRNPSNLRSIEKISEELRFFESDDE